jgi:hypothetical protein
VIPPKTLFGISVCLLVLSAGFGVLNVLKTRGLRTEVVQTENSRKAAEQFRSERENELKRHEAAVASADARLRETQTRVADKEAELIKARKENDNLQAKLHEHESETAQLRTRIDEPDGNPAVEINPSNASTADLQVQLDDAKRQLKAAEQEKASRTDKVRVRERATPGEAGETRRPPLGVNPGIHGTVLAVNRAYNFVVLNLGGRQGVEPNSEMLVLRGGSLIGRIRISSVEPATAIGDIITSSLARGVQVQPGDTVIYAGTNS